jgi:hypothetical protein
MFQFNLTLLPSNSVQEVLGVVVQEQIHDVIQQLLRFTAKAC